MLKKYKPCTPFQTLLMEDENWWRVSIAKTPDNGRETAVLYNWYWCIKMWNHETEMSNIKTIEDAVEIIKEIDSERSEYSTHDLLDT